MINNREMLDRLFELINNCNRSDNYVGYAKAIITVIEWHVRYDRAPIEMVHDHLIEILSDSAPAEEAEEIVNLIGRYNRVL